MFSSERPTKGFADQRGRVGELKLRDGEGLASTGSTGVLGKLGMRVGESF